MFPVSMLFYWIWKLMNMKKNLLYMVSAPPPIKIGWLNLKINSSLWVELKIYWGVIIITKSLHLHYFISLKTTNTQKSEVFLLRNVFSGNVNASAFTCLYPQIYNFSCRKVFLETLCKCICLGFSPKILKHHLLKQFH